MIDVLDTTTVAPTTLANSNAASVIISAIAGAISAVSINILAYAAHLERQNGHRRRVRWALPVNLVLGVVAQLIFVKATNEGPVALAMPVQTAAQLMLNMLIQVGLQMKEFTKGMRVGTMTIVCAIICLIDVGPADTHLTASTVLKKLSSQIFLACNALITLLGIIIIWFNPRGRRVELNESLRSYPRREMATSPVSLYTMVGYAAAQSSTIVFTTSLGKLLGDFTVPEDQWYLLACGVLWLLISAFNVVVASLAAKRCDASFYVPLFAGSKLLLNAVAGLCVWEDNLQNHITAYIMVYCLIIMGVYLLSSIDVAGMVALRRMRAGAGGTNDFPTSAMGEVTQDLLSLWRQLPFGGERNEEYASQVVRCFLAEGLDSDTWDDKALLELCMAMLKGKCSTGDPQLLGWIKWNLQSEPKLVQELVALRPMEDPEDAWTRKSTTFRSFFDGAMDVALDRRVSSDTLRSANHNFGSERASSFEGGARPESVVEEDPGAALRTGGPFFPLDSGREYSPGGAGSRPPSARANRSWESEPTRVDVEVAARPLAQVPSSA